MASSSVENELRKLPSSLLMALALQAEEREKPTARKSTTPKLGDALGPEVVPDHELSITVEACEESARIGSLDPVRDRNPELARAIAANSEYRNKPILHSIRVAIVRLTMRAEKAGIKPRSADTDDTE